MLSASVLVHVLGPFSLTLVNVRKYQVSYMICISLVVILLEELLRLKVRYLPMEIFTLLLCVRIL